MKISKQNRKILLEDADQYIVKAKDKASQLINEGKKKSEKLVAETKEKVETLLGEAEKSLLKQRIKPETYAHQGQKKIEKESERLKTAIRAGMDAYKTEKDA